MIRLDKKKHNIISTVKQQKCQHYHKVRIEKYECLTSEGVLPLDQNRIIKQTKFTYLLYE